MAAPLVWPSILVPSSERWNPNAGASRSGGQTIDNAEQVVVGPTGRVTAGLTVPCKDDARVLAMRALLAGLDGRAGSVLVGPIEVSRVPWFVDPTTGGKIATKRGELDAARDPAWDANADTSADLDFRTLGAVALNATTMTIRRNRGGLLAPGMFFEIAGRMHMITALTTADPTGAGGLAAPGNIGVQFRPWARADYAAGTLIEFARPRCTMRLATDDTGAMELQLSRFGTVTLDLVEAS